MISAPNRWRLQSIEHFPTDVVNLLYFFLEQGLRD